MPNTNYVATTDPRSPLYGKSYDDVLLFVRRNGILLIYADEQTEELCMAAVQQNGHSVQYAKYQTPIVSMTAVTQNGLSLQFIEAEQTEDLCRAAVKQNPAARMYVDPAFLHLFN